ncbi:MAG: phosphate-binding protein [Chlorobiaceae bacterium]|nr:phosphate-binding protein [Chlorobiaceae bacterium]
MSAVRLEAHDQIHIAGSHTLEPFAQYVSQEFSKGTTFPSPIYKSVGSEAAIDMLIKGDDVMRIDIALLSKNIDHSDLGQTKVEEVNDIIQMPVGLDGIVLANSREGAKLRLTRKDLFFALAAEVPLRGKLEKNPYKTWNQIRPDLPKQKILVYGPPVSSGTRQVFVEKVIGEQSRTMPEYLDYCGKYLKIRRDGAYVAIIDHDETLLDEVMNNKDAIGIISYGLYMQNRDAVRYATVDGFAPTYENIESGKYPISRKLFMYVHGSNIPQVKGIRTYIELFLSEEMIGDNGQLSDLGLIPLSSAERLKNRIEWLKQTSQL